MVNLLIFFIGLIGVELIFGHWFNPQRMNRLNLMKNVSLSYDVCNLYQTPGCLITYKRDRYGFRGNYKDLAKIDILTMGGSTTDQRFLSEGKTWQDVLARDFDQAGKDVRVVNAGVDGQSTMGHMKSFDWWFPNIPDLKVKYFLFFIGINDFYRAGSSDEETQPSAKKFIKERSALYHAFNNLRGFYRSRYVYKIASGAISTRNVRWMDRPILENPEPALRKRLDQYESRLRLLIEKAQAWGGIPIVVTQKTGRHRLVNGKLMGIADVGVLDGKTINGIDYFNVLNLYNKRAIEVCRETRCIPIDLAAELVFDEDDFYDFMHTTPKGSEKIGHYLFAQLHTLADL